MDIANLGVRIDPRGAVEGARQVTRALDQVGDAAEQNLGAVDRGNQRVAQSSRAAGRVARAGFMDMASGIQGALQSLGLMNGPIGRVISQMEGFWRSTQILGAGMRQNRGAMNEMAGAAGNASGALNGMAGSAGGAARAASSMGVIVAGLTTAFLALVAALTAVGIAWATFKAGLPIAAQLEQATTGFAVLLGSFEQAEQKIAEIKDFAAATPFESTQLIQGARYLETFTQGLLNNTEGWKLVGDAAAGAQRDFSEVAMWTGRMYAALKGGQPIGEATMRLMEMGLITPGVKGQLDAMAESGNEGGKKFAEIWGVAEQSLKRFSGTMALQSGTWDGLMSTLRDNWSLMQADFAEPIMIALKPALQDLIRFIEMARPIVADIGAQIGAGISTLYGAVKSDQLGSLLGVTLIAGFETAASWWTEFWVNSIGEIGTNLGNTLQQAAAKAAEAFTKAFEGFVKWLSESMAALAPKPVVNAADKVAGMGPFKWISKMAENSATEKGMREALQMNLPKGSPLRDDPQNPFTVAPAPFQRVSGDSIVGTTYRDKAAQMAFELQPTVVEKPKLPAPPSSGGVLGGDSSGKAAKAAKPLKAEPIISEMEKLMDAWGELGAQIDQSMSMASQSIAGNMTDALTGMIMGATSAKQAFSEMATSIVSDIIRMILQMTIQLAIAKALGQYGVFFQGVAAGVAHAGGVAGDGLPQRRAGGIPKYHQGGELSSEATVRLDKGETVLTRRRASELARELDEYRSAKGGQQQRTGGQATIINVLDRNEISDAVARNPGAVVNAMSRNLPTVRKMVMTGARA